MQVWASAIGLLLKHAGVGENEWRESERTAKVKLDGRCSNSSWISQIVPRAGRVNDCRAHLPKAQDLRVSTSYWSRKWWVLNSVKCNLNCLRANPLLESMVADIIIIMTGYTQIQDGDACIVHLWIEIKFYLINSRPTRSGCESGDEWAVCARFQARAGTGTDWKAKPARVEKSNWTKTQGSCRCLLDAVNALCVCLIEYCNADIYSRREYLNAERRAWEERREAEFWIECFVLFKFAVVYNS